MNIWRGDSDNTGVRKLKFCITTAAGLYTTLINSGNPLALNQQGFVSSIQMHSHGGWNTSHFLSFSKNRAIAESFAVGLSGKTLSRSNYTNWDCLIAEIDLSKLTHKGTLSIGIDHYQYQELPLQQSLINLNTIHQIGFEAGYNTRRASNWPTTRNFILVDVYTLLNQLATSGYTISPVALYNSQVEEEVLVLPADPLWNEVGNSAQLDLGALSKIEYFNLIP